MGLLFAIAENAELSLFLAILQIMYDIQLKKTQTSHILIFEDKYKYDIVT